MQKAKPRRRLHLDQLPQRRVKWPGHHRPMWTRSRLGATSGALRPRPVGLRPAAPPPRRPGLREPAAFPRLSSAASSSRATRTPRSFEPVHGTCPQRFADGAGRGGVDPAPAAVTGARPARRPADRPPATVCNNRPYTRPNTTPKRSPTCRRVPTRFVSSDRPGGSYYRSSFRTTRTPPARSHRHRRDTASSGRLGRHFPIPPRWADGNRCHQQW